MRCLTDLEIQAAADREAPADAMAHVAACRRCSDLVEERRRRMASLEHTIAERTAMPPAAAERVERAILATVQHGSTPPGRSGRGATRLRDVAARPAWHRAAWSGAAVIVAIVALVFVIPAVRGPQTVSAAEILSKSASTLSAAERGVEFREYELVLDGMPRDLMPDDANGTYRIRQAIDHDTKGRFKFASYSQDGRLLTSIAQDPDARTRLSLMRVDDRYYRFEFAMPPADVPSLPELERLYLEASIAMMQASGQQLLQEVETREGKQYVIDMPQVNTASVTAVWDLAQSRLVVDARDFRIQEFAASGTFLKQPYSVSYKLLNRLVSATVPPGTFELPHQDGEILITGHGTANPAGDALLGALRALARTRP